MKTTPRVNVFTDFAAFCKLRDELLKLNTNYKPLLLSMKSDWMADILSGRKQEEYRPFKDFYHPRIPSANPVLITFHCGYGGHRSLHVLCASKNPARVGYGRADWGSPSHGDYGCACYCIDIARIFAVYFPPNYSGVIPDRRFSPDGKIRGYFSLWSNAFVSYHKTKKEAAFVLSPMLRNSDVPTPLPLDQTHDFRRELTVVEPRTTNQRWVTLPGSAGIGESKGSAGV